MLKGQIYPANLIYHPVHMRLSNRFETDCNWFGRHVTGRKKCQIDSNKRPSYERSSDLKLILGLMVFYL